MGDNTQNEKPTTEVANETPVVEEVVNTNAENNQVNNKPANTNKPVNNNTNKSANNSTKKNNEATKMKEQQDKLLEGLIEKKQRKDPITGETLSPEEAQIQAKKELEERKGTCDNYIKTGDRLTSKWEYDACLPFFTQEEARALKPVRSNKNIPSSPVKSPVSQTNKPTVPSSKAVKNAPPNTTPKKNTPPVSSNTPPLITNELLEQKNKNLPLLEQLRQEINTLETSTTAGDCSIILSNAKKVIQTGDKVVNGMRQSKITENNTDSHKRNILKLTEEIRSKCKGQTGGKRKSRKQRRKRISLYSKAKKTRKH